MSSIFVANIENYAQGRGYVAAPFAVPFFADNGENPAPPRTTSSGMVEGTTKKTIFCKLTPQTLSLWAHHMITSKPLFSFVFRSISFRFAILFGRSRLTFANSVNYRLPPSPPRPSPSWPALSPSPSPSPPASAASAAFPASSPVRASARKGKRKSRRRVVYDSEDDEAVEMIG